MLFSISLAGRLHNKYQPHPRAIKSEIVRIKKEWLSLGTGVEFGQKLQAEWDYQVWRIEIESLDDLVQFLKENDAVLYPSHQVDTVPLFIADAFIVIFDGKVIPEE